LDKNSLVAGGAIGATAMIIVFAITILPLVDTPLTPKDLIVSNGHNPDTVGQITITTKANESRQITTTDPLSLIEIFEQSESGVVRVNIHRDNRLERNGVGSGFVFDKTGHIITNAHVIEDSEKIIVTFLDGRSYNAELIGEDPHTDIAVIKVDADELLLKPLKLGDSEKLKVGEQIAAIGNPFGLSGSMTSGIISQLGRLLPSQDNGFSIPDVIQIDAAINPGNSGGPLLNSRGEIVGINTAIQSGIGEFAGVGFAVPSQTIAKIVPTLIKEGEYNHPWLGISGRDIDPDLAEVLGLEDAKGFLVINVIDDSPAAKAGMRGTSETKSFDGIAYPVGGDIIVSVDGKDVRKIDDILIHLQRQKSVGDALQLKILRDGEIVRAILILEQRPDS
jgi:S1-C subfamily serine protease